jgi:spermidine synthase/Tfp pilus assembly protein PilF
MKKSKSFLSIFFPSATVFLSSGCIMVLELVASRLIAKHLGSSLYTWTSVIGVVLAGIAIGNYLGGRIADRFNTRKALALLFGICSVACVVVVILNNIVGEWMFLWYLKWPVRVFTHVCLVFLIPSALLGTISPVVAKMALDRGLPTGRTVGDIYAWGAAGSIAGTFLTGFYLIAAIGTIAIVWTVGAVLLLMAILYWCRLWVLYAWAVIFIALTTMGTAPVKWAESSGSSLGLRAKPKPDILYEDESQYNYIAVKQSPHRPNIRIFLQDKLMHSIISMNNIRELEYSYAQIYAAATERLSQGKDTLSVLIIGGGGYVYPRYVEEVWPGSRVDVAEIDPGVTEVAVQAFGLERDTTINIFEMDARNYVDELLKKKRSGQRIPKYDFVYEDAINDFTVPYQLVTKEFNDKITQILADDGVYMVNLIDMYVSGRFLGAVINTLEQTFSNVYVLSEIKAHNSRNTFVVVAAKQKVNLEELINRCRKDVDIWYLNDAEMNTLRQKSGGIILTDDYVPTENMLAPVVNQGAVNFLSERYVDLAKDLKRDGKLNEAIATYKALGNFDPTMSILAYYEIAEIMEQQGRLREGIRVLRQAIKHNEQAETKINIADVHFGLGLMLDKLEQPEESMEHFRKAIEGFRRKLARNPRAIEAIIKLGVALMKTGNLPEATKYLQQAADTADVGSYDVEAHLILSEALSRQGRHNEAIKRLRDGIGLMREYGRKDDVTKLQEFLETIEREKTIHQK